MNPLTNSSRHHHGPRCSQGAAGLRAVQPVDGRDARPTARPTARRAFTLIELLIAVGVIAFLIVGIGQIFRSVSSLVSIGVASAEVEQMARSIERQLRDDFEALSAMNPEDTFIAVRMREIGDVNRSGEVDDPEETAVYLTFEDRDADNRDIADGIIGAPYDEGSRAVTVRVDEIVFLARPRSGAFTSFEQSRFGDQTATAPEARIYYGHLLRPPLDPTWPPDTPSATTPRVPQRFFIPDGDFGRHAGDQSQNRFVTDLNALYGSVNGSVNGADFDFSTVTGRNEFAASWMLGRQALVLAGGEAAGNKDTSFPESSFGNEREYAPYIRDIETIDRLWGNQALDFQLDHHGPQSGVYDGNSSNNIFPPAPRLIQHGRVDLVAQDLRDVKRWLEGEPWPMDGISPPMLMNQLSAPFFAGRFSPDAQADRYTNGSSGPLDDVAFGQLPVRTIQSVRSMLWQQPDSNVVNFTALRLGSRTAIAGVFTRILADETPPYIDRNRDTSMINQPVDNMELPIDVEDAFMDSHAILTGSCSNFEIAWRLAVPDWPKASRDIDVDGDGVPEFRNGDRIWIDITPLDKTANSENQVNNSRSTVQNWQLGNIVSNAPFAIGDVGFGSLLGGGFSVTFAEDDFGLANHQPELGYQDWHNVVGTRYGFRLGQAVPGNPAATRLNNPMVPTPIYNPDISMGAPEDEREYLAIWPFRAPNANGIGYETEGFPKKLQFRIRMTLHDSQNRLKGGRTFEYIFDVTSGG